MSKLTKTIVAVVATGGLVFGLATAAYASQPAGTTITANAEVGNRYHLRGRHRLGPDHGHVHQLFRQRDSPGRRRTRMDLSAPPTINGCTDTSGGTDTITTNGTWTATISKKTMTLGAPKAGATFKSNVLSGCTITAFPKKPGKVKGKYNGTNTDTVTNAKVATKGSGCTSTTATTTGTIVLSPAPGAPPW